MDITCKVGEAGLRVSKAKWLQWLISNIVTNEIAIEAFKKK